MLKLNFSFVVFFICFLGYSQQEKKDTLIPKIERFGVRFGIDVVKLSRSFLEKNYQGIELVGDYRVTKRYYLAAELGNENTTIQDTYLNFTTKGTFLKVGFDYNLYENWLGMENMVYIGMRYGASSFSQTLNTYKIYNTNAYFGESKLIESGEKFDGLNAQWLETLVGIKAEIFSNFYVGFSVRLNYLISNKKPDNFDNLFIPGFNRTYEGSFGAGLNYTFSYFIPLYKTTELRKKVK